jgi:hypothetical protein
MSLAAELRAVLARAAQTLAPDVGRMAADAASILGAHLDGGAVQLADDGALALIDHLFRGSAAAGAINSLPRAPEPAAQAEVPPGPAPEAASTPPGNSPESSAPAEQQEPDTHMATPDEVAAAAAAE